MNEKKFYMFIGTTAELIKLAPIIKDLKRKKIEVKIITSGQNKIHFEEFISFTGKLKVHRSFKEKVNKSSTLFFSLWAIITFINALFTLNKELSSDRDEIYFIVHGDTVTALMGTLIAKIHGLRVVHVESGLYSHNYLEPFPEEISRNIIDRVSDILFPSNDKALENVSIFKGVKVKTVENTLWETFNWALKLRPKTKFLKNKNNLGRYYVLSMHRQENIFLKKNVAEKMLNLVLEKADPILKCVLMKHPLTLNLIRSSNLSDAMNRKNIVTIPRLPYPDYLKLMRDADFIATDSCMNQLEAYYLGVPYLGLRTTTEQLEGLGHNVVISKGEKRVILNFLKNYKKYRSKPVISQHKPSKIIVDYLLDHSAGLQ